MKAKPTLTVTQGLELLHLVWKQAAGQKISEAEMPDKSSPVYEIFKERLAK